MNLTSRWATKTLIYLAYPSQRPLRQRLTFPWSIARYYRSQSRFLFSKHTWDETLKNEAVNLIISSTDIFKTNRNLLSMRCVDKILAWPVWDQIARTHHDASNISYGGPVARLKNRSLPHSCEGSHQLVPWIDLFSLNVLFSDQAMPEFTVFVA